MGKLVKFLNLLIFYLILFLFAFIPLYPKFPLINISGTFVAIRIEDIVIALVVSLWGFHIVFSKHLKSILEDKVNKALILFFFIGLISTFSAIFLTHSVISHISILHFLRRIEFMILLPVVATVVNSKKRFIWVLSVLGLTILSVNIYGLGQLYLNWPVISTTNSEFSKGLILRLASGARVNSTFAGHYDLAVFLAMMITLLTGLFFAVRNSLRVVVFVLGGLSLMILIFTAARQSFIAGFIGLILALIFSRKKKYIFLFLILAIGILIYPNQLRDRFVSTFTINVLNLGTRYEGKTEDQQIRSKLNIPTLAIKTSSESAQTSTFATGSGTVATDITPGEPIDTTQLGVYRSFQIRLQIEWPRAIAAFWKNPFLGTGYSSIEIATDNDFLRSIGEVGILGTSAMVLILISVGRKLFICLKYENKLIRYFSAGVLAMLFAFIINGLFIDVFEASKVASLFWMILGLNLAVMKFNK